MGGEVGCCEGVEETGVVGWGRGVVVGGRGRSRSLDGCYPRYESLSMIVTTKRENTRYLQWWNEGDSRRSLVTPLLIFDTSPPKTGSLSLSFPGAVA